LPRRANIANNSPTPSAPKKSLKRVLAHVGLHGFSRRSTFLPIFLHVLVWQRNVVIPTVKRIDHIDIPQP